MESNTSSIISTTLTPTSDICSCVDEDRFIDTERAANLLTGFSKLYQNKEFVDVILVVGSSEYPCHKNVLAGSSPYFMAMFSNNMAERHQEKVTLNDMDAQTLSLVLDYIYTGQVMLTEETVQNLLSASNLFQLISLRDGCAQFMMNHVTVSNCIGIYFFAKAHQCEILASKGKEMINNQFSTLCHQQEFLLLPADKLVEIIKDSDICVDREEVVFEACMEWLNHDTGSRSKFLVDIINCVRFANISSYYFCDKIVKNKCLNDNEEIRKKLDMIRYYHMLRNRQQEMDLNLMPRKGMPYERGVMILANPYTEDALKKYNTMELLLPKSGEVITICRLPQSLYTPEQKAHGPELQSSIQNST
ncbi:kelch-like protein 40a isoform X4 [Patella vulgata]|uniref:kelch-like protein 40a isoform X4 n=1 Tax=Patella vulgata TaxID=6465 RepID=UPI00217F57EC|nr:kelch-like protein 40a isoform X4 [Patella vulgata]